MLISGLIPGSISESLKVITYGTERMDEPTLKSLCRLLPNIDFRQTFGMSELGIVRVKSKSRDSLFMKIGGEGIETRVVNSSLEIRSQSRMLGYLNASSPFDKNNWYKTNDIVEEKEGYYKIIGRTNEVINVGGLKFMASEVERVALEFDGVELVKAEGKFNPITGQHVELSIQAKEKYLNIVEIKTFLKNKLPKHMMPSRIKISKINIGHRYKKI
jgi:acyl-CoA synthetase (AMP-forming)/AMP-acid ligase II